MRPPFPDTDTTESDPLTLLESSGCVFATFDHRTQDSGNVSYGAEIDGRRYFVKTAGRPDNTKPFFDHAERVASIRNAVHLAQSASHRTLPKIHQVIESPTGPMLVYDWVDGDLVRNCLDRVRDLPASEVTALLTDIYDLHRHLVSLGWIAVDFYDGAMIYDFDHHRVHAIDLDSYHEGPFTNQMGRMFGSTRFMAPEEFELGATIDERTTVFTMGRTAAVLMSDGSLDRDPFKGTDTQYDVILKACANHPNDRIQTVAELHTTWTAASNHPLSLEGEGWGESLPRTRSGGENLEYLPL